VESLTAVDASTFVAPAGSLAIDRRIFLEATVVQGNVLRKVQPQYPSEAKAERVQGTVVLEAVIGRDGAISHVEPIGGPPMLIDPSLKAVRQWKYKPYEIDGEAVEVDTLISVVYSMGN
jgi:protein TonB